MEVMFAMVVLAIAISVMMPIIPLGLERLRDMRMMETAVWLAEQEVETIRHQLFADIAPVAKQDADILPLKKEVTVVNRSSTLKEITVKISWQNVRAGLPDRQTTLVTLLSKNGINR